MQFLYWKIILVSKIRLTGRKAGVRDTVDFFFWGWGGEGNGIRNHREALPFSQPLSLHSINPNYFLSF
jgi:hypothetical protein